MPFNIELSQFYRQSQVAIKIQVTKNTITVYFNGPTEQTYAPIDAWTHLEKHFIKDLPGFNKTWVRGPDAPHIKLNHTCQPEISIRHFHREFNTEVTPELFSLYLNKLFIQQSGHHEEEYVFFESIEEIKQIAYNFNIYYQKYHGSDTEAQFTKETRLTPEESAAYKEAVQMARAQERLDSLAAVQMARAQERLDSLATKLLLLGAIFSAAGSPRNVKHEGASAEEHEATRAEEYEGTGAEEYEGTGAEEYEGTGAEEYEGTRAEEYEGAGAEEHEGTRAEEYEGTRAEEHEDTDATHNCYCIIM